MNLITFFIDFISFELNNECIDQTLNSVWTPNLKALFSLIRFDAWTPTETFPRSLAMKLGCLSNKETSSFELTLTLVVSFCSGKTLSTTTWASFNGFSLIWKVAYHINKMYFDSNFGLIINRRNHINFELIEVILPFAQCNRACSKFLDFSSQEDWSFVINFISQKHVVFAH